MTKKIEEIKSEIKPNVVPVILLQNKPNEPTAALQLYKVKSLTGQNYVRAGLKIKPHWLITELTPAQIKAIKDDANLSLKKAN